MSHTYVTAVPSLKDPVLLGRAFESLGWSMTSNARARTWHNNPDRDKIYPLVGVNPLADGYDVGVVNGADGLELRADQYSPGGVAQALGRDYGRLIQHYNLAHLRQQAAKKGWRVQVQEKDGDLYVEVNS